MEGGSKGSLGAGGRCDTGMESSLSSQGMSRKHDPWQEVSMRNHLRLLGGFLPHPLDEDVTLCAKLTGY